MYGRPSKLDNVHLVYVRELLRRDGRLTLAELCSQLQQRHTVRVSVATMHRALVHRLGFSRKRTGRGLPKQALTERNVVWRRQFVAKWFGASADLSVVGTNEEIQDQRNWQLQVIFIQFEFFLFI